MPIASHATFSSQVDRHLAEMTVRETLAFSARMMGQGFGADGECEEAPICRTGQGPGTLADGSYGRQRSREALIHVDPCRSVFLECLKDRRTTHLVVYPCFPPMHVVPFP